MHLHKAVGSLNWHEYSNHLMELLQNQSQDMHSILEFMCLGVTTFYKERLQDILSHAKDVKIMVGPDSMEFKYDLITDLKKEMPDEDNNPVVQKYENVGLDSQTLGFTRIHNNEENQGGAKSIQKNYPCTQCGHNFASRTGRLHHVKAKHMGVKYACKKCNSEFTQQYHLTDHIQSAHNGVKPSCDQCGTQFTNRRNLQIHIKSIHEGIVVTCNHCGQHFSQKYQLKSHVDAIHIGIKHTCHFCGTKYSQKGQMNAHIRSKHLLLNTDMKI